MSIVTRSSSSEPLPHRSPAGQRAGETAKAPPNDTGDSVLSVDEAAGFLKIGRNALYDAIGRGDVPHRRIGKTIRLSRAALVRWLEGSCGAASKQGF